MMQLLGLLSDTAILAGIPLSLWITFRICRYPDLALELWVAFGGAVYGYCKANGLGSATWLVPTAVVALTAGFGTALLRTWRGVPPILLSVAIAYILYSGTLATLGGANLNLRPFLAEPPHPETALLYSGAAYGLIGGALWAAFKTRFGMRILASGSNPELARRHRVETVLYQTVALAGGFAIAMVSGALYSWRAANCDISYGGGNLVYALACVIVVRYLVPRPHMLLACLGLFACGLAFNFILQFSLAQNLPPQWTRGITGAILLVVLVFAVSRGESENRIL